MLFGQIWLKIEKVAILAWVGREVQNLQAKLNFKGGFNNWEFGRYLHFRVRVIKVSLKEDLEKNWKFERLYVEKYI